MIIPFKKNNQFDPEDMMKYMSRRVLGIAGSMTYRRSMKTKSESERMPYYLCEDLVDDIIGCLPSKSLLRLRSLSKSWCCRISSSNFIRKHAIRSATKKSPQTCFVRKRLHYSKNSFETLYRLHPKGKYMGSESVKFPTKYCEIVGSCFGIICLHGGENIPSITLWNPSIRRKLIVPNVPHVKAAFGFGYDPLADDFKIVGISVQPAQTSFIYSLKTSSWSEIALPTPLSYRIRTLPCFVNGVLHWVVQSESLEDAYIITFDLSSHVFGVISLPRPGFIIIRLTIINGSLAVISGNNDNRWIWVRSDASCWSKPIRFTTSEFQGTVDTVFQHKTHLGESGVSYTFNSYSDASYTIDMDFGLESLYLLDHQTCDRPYFLTLWRYIYNTFFARK